MFDDRVIEYKNPGRDDYFTCPGCMADINDLAHRITKCPDCGVALICSVEEQPVAVCTLANVEEDEDDG